MGIVAPVNPKRVVSGFWSLAATLNFGFSATRRTPGVHKLPYELYAAVIVNIIAVVLKFGDWEPKSARCTWRPVGRGDPTDRGDGCLDPGGGGSTGLTPEHMSSVVPRRRGPLANTSRIILAGHWRPPTYAALTGWHTDRQHNVATRRSSPWPSAPAVLRAVVRRPSYRKCAGHDGDLPGSGGGHCSSRSSSSSPSRSSAWRRRLWCRRRAIRGDERLESFYVMSYTATTIGFRARSQRLHHPAAGQGDLPRSMPRSSRWRTPSAMHGVGAGRVLPRCRCGQRFARRVRNIHEGRTSSPATGGWAVVGRELDWSGASLRGHRPLGVRVDQLTDQLSVDIPGIEGMPRIPAALGIAKAQAPSRGDTGVDR